MSNNDQNVLDDLAEALRVSDLRLARGLTGRTPPRHRMIRWVFPAVTGLTFMTIGLLLTPALPYWVTGLTVAGFMCVAAARLFLAPWVQRVGRVGLLARWPLLRSDTGCCVINDSGVGGIHSRGLLSTPIHLHFRNGFRYECR